MANLSTLTTTSVNLVDLQHSRALMTKTNHVATCLCLIVEYLHWLPAVMLNTWVKVMPERVQIVLCLQFLSSRAVELLPWLPSTCFTINTYTFIHSTLNMHSFILRTAQLHEWSRREQATNYEIDFGQQLEAQAASHPDLEVATTWLMQSKNIPNTRQSTTCSSCLQWHVLTWPTASQYLWVYNSDGRIIRLLQVCITARTRRASRERMCTCTLSRPGLPHILQYLLIWFHIIL